MTYDQLEMLEKIVEKGSFKAAAEALNKTQPSLSVAIKKLEEEFGILLFNREEYRPQLTDEGRVFYGWLKQSLRSFRDLEVVGKQLGQRKVEARLTMIIDPLVQFDAIEGLFENCLAWPNVTDFTLKTEVLGGGMESLLSGKADFAIAPKVVDHEDIESISYEKVEMIPVVAKNLLKKGESIDALWLQRQRQIVVVQGGDAKSPLKREKRGVLAEGQKCFVTDHTTKMRLILGGFGWGRLPMREIQGPLRKGMLVKISHEVASPFSLELRVMRNRLKPLGPVARVIWDHLRGQSWATKKGKA